MKQALAVLLVVIVVAGIGVAGYWIGRTGAPASPLKNEIATASGVAQTTSRIHEPVTVATVADAENVTPKKLQSTSISPAAPSGPAPKQSSAATQSDQRKPPTQSAADIIAALETDDHKSAFPNPSIAPHQAMLNETPDPNWSQAAAQQLRDYLAAQLGNRFEYPLVQCGQDICEIQAATIPGSDRHADVRDFQLSDENMRLQTWWSTLQFDELTFQVDSVDDGRDVMIVFITRK